MSPRPSDSLCKSEPSVEFHASRAGRRQQSCERLNVFSPTEPSGKPQPSRKKKLGQVWFPETTGRASATSPGAQTINTGIVLMMSGFCEVAPLGKETFLFSCAISHQQPPGGSLAGYRSALAAPWVEQTGGRLGAVVRARLRGFEPGNTGAERLCAGHAFYSVRSLQGQVENVHKRHLSP